MPFLRNSLSVYAQRHVQLGALLNQNFHYYINENLARTASQNMAFNGTVRNVGAGQTYSTITAALAASASGDIIQLADGTYDMNNEANGYLLYDAPTKDILIRGNVNNNSSVVITQNGASNFTVRLYKSKKVCFENITFVGKKNLGLVVSAFNAGASWQHILKNCNFDITYNGNASRVYIQESMSNGLELAGVEFDNCTFTRLTPTVAILFYLVNTGINYQALFKSCNFNVGICLPVSIINGNECSVSIYDCNIEHSANTVILQFGNDTTTPTKTLGLIDIRNCNIAYANGFASHAILLGRGTSNLYVVNNNITIPAINTSAATGVVVKSIGLDIQNTVIAGNYIDAPRPFVIKGGSNVRLRYNSAKCNYSIPLMGYGLNIYNTDEGDGVLVISNNEIKNNNIFGLSGSIISLSGNDLIPKTTDSIQSCVFDSNKYYSENGAWANDGDIHQLATKETFWTGNATNDINSRMTSNNTIIVSAIKKDI
jgi:hypothetical protein